MRDIVAERLGDSFYLAGSHPLRWSYNKSSTALILQMDEEPDVLQRSSKAVSVRKWRQADGRWAIAFILVDDSYSEQFRYFCEDVVESSRSVPPEKGASFAYGRFLLWMRMFRPAGGKLSEEFIRGLMGEIFAMQRVLIPRYGEITVLKAWMNARRGKQDFVMEDSWYEVKSILEGSAGVTITSFEQLDRDDSGGLVVVQLRKASPESPLGMNINKLIREFIDSLGSAESKDILLDTLEQAGYSYTEEYNCLCFDCLSLTLYVVDSNFPRIRRSQLNEGIVCGSYEISLDSISEWRVERWS